MTHRIYTRDKKKGSMPAGEIYVSTYKKIIVKEVKGSAYNGSSHRHEVCVLLYKYCL